MTQSLHKMQNCQHTYGYVVEMDAKDGWTWNQSTFGSKHSPSTFSRNQELLRNNGGAPAWTPVPQSPENRGPPTSSSNKEVPT